MTADAESERFPSFNSMRTAHSQLIKQYSLDAVTDSEGFIAPAMEFMRKAQATGALLDNDNERESAQTMLDYWSTRLYRLGKTGSEILLADFNADLAPELPDHLCPYRGLSAFNEDDAAVFFGRRKTVAELVELIQSAQLAAVVGPSGSGKSSMVRAGLLPELKSGKIKGSQDWVYIPIFVPGSKPLDSLARALENVGQETSTRWSSSAAPEPGVEEPAPISDAEIAAYVSDANHLHQTIQQRFGRTVVLVVDQFEEVFTLCDSEPIRRAFVENILALAKDSEAGHRVILTMRVDFEAKLSLLPDLQEALGENILRLTPLTAADLRQAIEEPANQIGLKFEEGLIDHLLNDILGEPAALPLLQFTLLKLWEHRDHNRITWENYKRLGGGRQALAKSADEFYNSLIPEEQTTARRILLRLVRPGEGLEVTSQRMRRLDLYTKGEAADRIDRVLNRFLQARLLKLTKGQTPYDDQIEVAHEALVRNWPTLVSWLETEREAIRQRRTLTIAAERWNELGCTDDLLLRGVELEEALRYDDLNSLESDFIQASQQARADEIEQAKKVADELRKRNRIITAASLVAGAVALIAIFLGTLALNQYAVANTEKAAAEKARDTAEEANINYFGQVMTVDAERARALDAEKAAVTAEAQAVVEKSTAQAANTQIVAQQATKDALSTQSVAQQTQVALIRERAQNENLLARSKSLADQARSLVSRQTDLGVLLGLEAAKLATSLEEKGVLLDTLRANPRLLTYLRGHEGAINAVAYRPDGHMLASAGADGKLILWPLKTANDPVELTPESVGGLNAVDFDPQSSMVAAGSCSALDRSGACSTGLLQFWDLTNTKYGITSMKIHRAGVLAVEFDPSGQRIATGAGDGVVQTWQIPPMNAGVWDAKPEFSFTGHKGEVRDLAFSPTGRYLASASADGTVLVRDLQKVAVIAGFIDHHSPVNAVAYSPDGRFLATGGDDANIFIYDMLRLVRIAGPLSKHTYAVTGLDFSPDGISLVSSSGDGTLIIWDLSELVRRGLMSNTPPSLVLQGHTDVVLSVAFSPDGRNLASGGRDGAVIQWSASEPYPLGTSFIASSDPVVSLGFNPQGNALLVERSDRTISRWDLATGLDSGGTQWTQLESMRYQPDITKVFYAPDGNLLGLRSNILQSNVALGVDVSAFNGTVDWAKVKNAAYSFAFAKASEGADRLDSQFAANWEGMLAAGIKRGAYHYFHPAEDPVVQAQFFAKTADLLADDLPPVVVVETNDDLPNNEVLQNLTSFLNELRSLTNRQPILFTNPNFWQTLTGAQSSAQQSSSASAFPTSEYLLWVANYTRNEQPSLPAGWGTWTFWQYSGEGQVPGIQGQVSLNRFNGTLQALQNLISGAPSISADAGMETTSLVNLADGQQMGAALPWLNPASIAYNPLTNQLATGAENGSITFWDMTTGSQLERVLAYSSVPVNSLAFSADGNLLASGNADGNVLIWNLSDSASQPIVLVGHSSRVNSLAFSPRGGLLASGSADGSIILWDLQTHNAIGQPLSGPNAAVSALAINPEGSLLASGNANGSAVIWNINPDYWQAQACQRANRNLTQQEWDKYFTGIDYHTTCP